MIMFKNILIISLFINVFCSKSKMNEFIEIIPCKYIIKKEFKNEHETHEKSININTVKIKAKNKRLEFLLNQNIKIFDNINPDEYYSDFLKRSFKSESWHTNSQTSVLYLNYDFIVFKQSYSSTAWGAAHGEFDIFYMNYDLKEKKKISLLDIFESKKINDLKQVCMLKVKNQYKLNNTTLEDFYFSENFAITKKGILFSFKLDQIHYGSIFNIIIPFSDLKNVMKSNKQLTQRIIN